MVLIPPGAPQLPPVGPPDWLAPLLDNLQHLPDRVGQTVSSSIEGSIAGALGTVGAPAAPVQFNNPFDDLAAGFSGFLPYGLAAVVVVVGVGVLEGVNPGWAMWLGLLVLVGVLIVSHKQPDGSTTTVGAQLAQLVAAVRGAHA